MGYELKKVTTSIGVIGVIYESRPNVTADVAALCLKVGQLFNFKRRFRGIQLRDKLLANLFRNSLAKHGIDKNCVQFIEKKNRKLVKYLLSGMSRYIDVIVPRGGKGLVEKVQKFSRVPTIGHLEGMCHIYVNKNSNINMASKVILNTQKWRRTESICGAVETVLIDSKAIKSHGIPIINKLLSAGCSVLVDKNINKIFKNKLQLAREKDWKTEYLDSKISMQSVSGVEEAISHILKYGTMHTQ